MKSLINSLKAKAAIAIFVILFAGAHAYSNGNGSNIPGNEHPVNITPVTNTEAKPYKALSKTSVEVKNIWHSMPSFDKYGNEITEHARLNMQMNAELERINKSISSKSVKLEKVK